jgi:formylglycine-generating enzyme
MKKILSQIATAIIISFTVSCDHGRSAVTAWPYNDPRNGSMDVSSYEGQETGPGLAFIQGGTFTMGRTEQDITYDWNNIPRRVTVSSFYMDLTEIRNLDYLEYLHWTGRVFGANFSEVVKKALPDTTVWRDRLAFNEPFVELYLRHPAYRDYPVVGVNWLQASDFCSWRTDRVNEYILVREGIIDWNSSPDESDYFNTDAYLEGKWTGTTKQNIPSATNPSGRQVIMADGIFLPRYRLPTEAEWEYAAYGLIGNTVGERIPERRIFSWNGHGTRNPDSKYLGQMMANFKRSNGDNMGVAGSLNDAGDITTPVYSYWPNDYGLYNMSGNVSEWVMDVYRPLSPEDKADFNPYRGNNFQAKQKDVNGIVIDDSVRYDADGNIVSIPGKVRWRDVSLAYPDDKLDERRNYNYADNINYKDGDIQSQIDALSGSAWTDTYDPSSGRPESRGMYNAPLKPGDKDISITSLINDKARVYKGGSWKDRAYWMGPGTRRFLDQRQAAAWLGFRCAMSGVGSPAGLGGR